MPGTQKVNYPEQINGTIPIGGSGLGIVGQENGQFVATGTILNVTGQRGFLSASGTILNLVFTPDPPELIGIYGLDNGIPLGTGTWMNFVGTGVTTSISGTVLNVNIPSASNPPVTGSVVIQDEGSTLGSATILNFVGANVQATLAGGTATINVTGSSGGGEANAHGCKLSRASGNFNVGNNTLTAVQFTSEDYDTDNMHDNASNNTRITIPTISGVTTGLWKFTAYGYTDVVTGRVDVQFKKGGSTIIGMALFPPSSTVGGYVGTTEAVLSAGDYVECLVRTTGGNGNVVFDTGSGISPCFIASFLGKVT